MSYIPPEAHSLHWIQVFYRTEKKCCLGLIFGSGHGHVRSKETTDQLKNFSSKPSGGFFLLAGSAL